jgi:hypothetical protein
MLILSAEFAGAFGTIYSLSITQRRRGAEAQREEEEEEKRY